MVTFGEILRWLVYRVKRSYFRLARRLLRGDRLLWRSERKFRALLEAAPEAMVIVDAHSHIALVNGQAEQLFGYKRREIVGTHINDLVPERLRAEHRSEMRAYMRDPDVRPMGLASSSTGCARTGPSSRSRSASARSRPTRGCSCRVRCATSPSASGPWPS